MSEVSAAAACARFDFCDVIGDDLAPYTGRASPSVLGLRTAAVCAAAGGLAHQVDAPHEVD
jgi:hypothetical protein